MKLICSKLHSYYISDRGLKHRCYGPNVCFSQNSYVEVHVPSRGRTSKDIIKIKWERKDKAMIWQN